MSPADEDEASGHIQATMAKVFKEYTQIRDSGLKGGRDCPYI